MASLMTLMARVRRSKQHPLVFLKNGIPASAGHHPSEKNCLCAIVKEVSSLTLDEVVRFLKGRVADYKLPEALVVMHDFR